MKDRTNNEGFSNGTKRANFFRMWAHSELVKEGFEEELTCPPKTSPGKMLDLGLIGDGAYLWVEGRILPNRSSR